MALITYILIAIPVCLLAIILWLYFDYWKYKRKNHFILLILLFLSDIVVCTIYGQSTVQNLIFIVCKPAG